MNRTEQAQRLHRELEERLGVAVKLTGNNNRSSMISCSWEAARVTIRLHHMFLLAEGPFLRTLASFCRRPTKRNREAINQFIIDHTELIDESPAKNGRDLPAKTKGQFFDLQELFDQVNTKYFKRSCDAVITWGQNGKRTRRRSNKASIRLGSYDAQTNVIRIHPVLDADWVPQYVMETLIYHEMLHWLFRPRLAGDRRVLHSRAFRQAEQAHPRHERTNEWIQKNLDRLLRR